MSYILSVRESQQACFENPCTLTYSPVTKIGNGSTSCILFYSPGNEPGSHRDFLAVLVSFSSFKFRSFLIFASALTFAILDCMEY